MPAEITKHGEAYYSLTRVHSRGHTTTAGQLLAGTDTLIFPFRRPDDPPGVNLDPADVISVLRQHLQGLNAAAAQKLKEVAALLSAPVATGTPEPAPDKPKNRGGRPRKVAAPLEPNTVVGGADDDDDEDENEGGEE